jgi:hypothetical protein
MILRPIIPIAILQKYETKISYCRLVPVNTGFK